VGDFLGIKNHEDFSSFCRNEDLRGLYQEF